MYDVYNVELGVFMYKYYNDLLPKIFKDFFTQRSDVHNYYTRNSENYNHTKNKKVFTDRADRTTRKFYGTPLMILPKIQIY